MNFKTTIALLLLLIIVGVFFYTQQDWTTTRDVEQAASETSADGLPLFTADELSTESITRIEVVRDGQTYVFEEDGDKWFQTRPVRVELNAWSARGIIDDLAGLTYREQLTPGKGEVPDAASLDLDPPRATVTISGELDGEATSHTVALGRTTIGGRGYAALPDRAGDTAYLVNDDLHDAVLDADMMSLRKRSLTGPAAGAVQRLTLQREGATFELTKSDGRWALTGQHAGRADSGAANALANALQNTFLEKWVQDQPKDLSLYGLAEPSVTLTLHANVPTESDTPDAEPADADTATRSYTLLLGSPTELEGESRFGMLLTGDQATAPVFSLGKTYTEKLKVDLTDLRDKAISLLEPSDVRAVRIERDAGNLAFDKSPDGWAFGEGVDPGFTADTSVVAELVESLTGTEGEPMTDASAWQGEPAVTVTLSTIAQPAPETLAFYPGDDGPVVVRNREPVGYVVDPALLDSLTAAALAFRDRSIPVVPEPAERVTLAPAAGPELTFVFADDGWTLEGHDVFESGAFRELLEMLRPLEADRWVIGDAEAITDPIMLTAQGSSGTAVLRVDPDTGIGQRDGITERFRVSDTLLDALRAEYRDRTAIPVAANAITRVALTAPDGSITLEREDDTWVGTGGEGLAPDKVKALIDALAGLEVVRYTNRTPVTLPSPSHTIEVNTTVGDVYTVNLYNGRDVASIGDRVAELSSDTLDVLRASVLSE